MLTQDLLHITGQNPSGPRTMRNAESALDHLTIEPSRLEAFDDGDGQCTYPS